MNSIHQGFLADTNKNRTKKKQINKEPIRYEFLNPGALNETGQIQFYQINQMQIYFIWSIFYIFCYLIFLLRVFQRKFNRQKQKEMYKLLSNLLKM